MTSEWIIPKGTILSKKKPNYLGVPCLWHQQNADKTVYVSLKWFKCGSNFIIFSMFYVVQYFNLGTMKKKHVWMSMSIKYESYPTELLQKCDGGKLLS